MQSKKILITGLSILALLMPILAGAVSTTLVISEFKARGANGYDEFIEIRNISASPIDLGDYDVAYGSSGGSISKLVSFTSGTYLPAGKTILAVNASSPSYIGLADVTYTGGISDNGQLAIRKISDSSVVDATAWGTGSFTYVFGNTTVIRVVTADSTKSIERLPFGINTTDTDNNVADFQLQTTPNPTALGIPKMTDLLQSPFVPNAAEACNLTVTAYGTGGNTISKVTVNWSVGTVAQAPIEMTAGASSTYTAVIPGQADGSIVRYSVVAYDNAGNTLALEKGYVVGTTAISVLRESDANGISLVDGLAARAAGIITVNAGAFASGTLSVYMQDNSGTLGKSGLNVYSSLSTYGTVSAGDSAVVEGVVTMYNGLLELASGPTYGGGTVVVVSSGNALPEAVVVPSLAGSLETYEGIIVEIPDFYSTFTASTTGSQNYNGWRGGDSGHQITLRLWSPTGLSATPPASYPISIKGILGQYDYSSPYLDSYQIMPRTAADFATTLVVSPAENIGVNPNQVVGFSVTGGTGPYIWSITSSGGASGTLSSSSGASVNLTVGPNNGTLYMIVTDSVGNHGVTGIMTVTPTSAPVYRELEE
jgi:hypothetical protein